MRLGLFFLFIQTALLIATASTAMTIVEWSPAVINAVAFDPTGPEVFETVYLANLPASGSLSAVSGGVSTSTDFSLSSAGVDLTFFQARNQIRGANNRTIVQVPFLAETSIDFVLSGMVSANDPDGRFIKLRAYLRDDSTGDYVFITETSSLSTPNEVLTLGLPDGEINSTNGSLAGSLIAGHEYYFYFEASLSNYPTAAPNPASAVGYLNLAFVPEPSAALMIAIGLAGLAATKRNDY